MPSTKMAPEQCRKRMKNPEKDANMKVPQPLRQNLLFWPLRCTEVRQHLFRKKYHRLVAFDTPSNQRKYGRTMRRLTNGSTGSIEDRAQKNGETLGKNDPNFLGQCRPLASSEPSIHLPEALCKLDCAGGCWWPYQTWLPGSVRIFQHT